MNQTIVFYLAAAIVVGFVKPVTVYFNLPKLGYKEYIISKKGREPEVISACICIVMWISLFVYNYKTSTITTFSPSLFSVLVGGMTGICISTIYTIVFMPRGFYEKGILTETKAVLYKEVGRSTTSFNSTKKIKRYHFPTFSDRKNNGVNLFVHIDDDKNVAKCISKHRK